MRSSSSMPSTRGSSKFNAARRRAYARRRAAVLFRLPPCGGFCFFRQTKTQVPPVPPHRPLIMEEIIPEVVYERNRLRDPAHAQDGGKILCAARRHGDAQFCAAHAGAPLLSASLCRARLRVRPAPCRRFPSSRRNSRPLVDGGALRPLAGSPSFGRILALQAFEAQDDVGKVCPARPCPAPLCLPLSACGIRAAPLFRLAEGAAVPYDGSACPFIRGGLDAL